MQVLHEQNTRNKIIKLNHFRLSHVHVNIYTSDIFFSPVDSHIICDDMLTFKIQICSLIVTLMHITYIISDRYV